MRFGEFKDRLCDIARPCQKREKDEEGRESWRQEAHWGMRRSSMRCVHHGVRDNSCTHQRRIHQADRDGGTGPVRTWKQTEEPHLGDSPSLPPLPSPPSEKEHITFTNHTSHSPVTVISFQTWNARTTCVPNLQSKHLSISDAQ